MITRDLQVESDLCCRSLLISSSVTLEMEAGDVFLVLDVRPELECQSGHIPEARSIPIDELDARLDELPRDQEIIAYCRDSYCV